MTIGIAGDASFGIGANSEIGLAIDNRDRRPAVIYSTLGYSIGWSAGAGAAWTVGFVKGPNDRMAGPGHGFAFSGKAIAGAGVGIGFDYDNRFQSLSASAAMGAGASAGTYVRSVTAVLTVGRR